jgi:hypothetical protein
MQFFGIVFILSTTFILIFKKESAIVEYDDSSDELSIKTTFKSLWQILKLAPIQKFLIILFTCKVESFFLNNNTMFIFII